MMPRAAAFRIIASHLGRRDVVVSSYSSLFEWLSVSPETITYLGVGAMGLDTSHALCFALAMPDRRIVTLQGDGSLMMNLGSLATLADQAPANLVHFTCRNTIYEANGGQPIPNGAAIDFPALARASGLKSVFRFSSLDELAYGLPNALSAPGPVFICIDVVAGEPPTLDYERLHAPDLIQIFQAELAATE
jgi:sulfopyruvate decarboxylase subunit beta